MEKQNGYLVFFLIALIIAEFISLMIFRTIVSESLRQRTSVCNKKERAEQHRCWENTITKVLNEKGIKAAFEIVADLYTKDPEFANDCHSFAHLIGERAYDLFVQGREVEVTEKVSYCGFGFFHAFMESLVSLGGDVDQARSFCTYMNERLSTLAQADDSCYHGIGHGTVDGSNPRSRGDPHGIIEPGLKMCNTIALTSDQLTSCAGGVFNSLAIMFRHNQYGLIPNKENPYAICDTQSKNEYRRGCYEQMNLLVLDINGFDFSKAVKFIYKIKDKKNIQHALFQLAGAAGGTSLKTNRDAEGIGVCQSLSEELKAYCLKGFMGGLMEMGRPGYEYERALKFCRSILDAQERNICFDFFLTTIRSLYNTDKVRSICMLLEDTWTKKCLGIQ